MQNKHKNEVVNTGGPYCPNCGQIVKPEMKFCPRCGSSLRVEAAPARAEIPLQQSTQISWILEATSIGVFFIVLALTYLSNPIDASIIVDYFQRMADQKVFVKPPQVILDSAIFFFTAMGGWGLILSALRIILEKNSRKACSNLLGGLFCLYISYLLTEYSFDTISAREALAYFVIGLGLLIIINAILQLIPKRRG